MSVHGEIRFALAHDEAAARLRELVRWLEDEIATAQAKLDAMPEPEPQEWASGRLRVTPSMAERGRLQSTILSLKSDLVDARCWMLECSTPQTWSVSLDLARWLNRPVLARAGNDSWLRG